MPWLTIHAMSWSSMFPASHLRVLWLWRIGNPITMLHIHCVIPRILNTLRGMLGYFFRRSWRRDVIFVYSCSILLTLGLCRPMSWLADSCSLVHTNNSPHVMLGWFVFYGTHEHFLGLLTALCLAVTQSWILGLSSTLRAHQSFSFILVQFGSLLVCVAPCHDWRIRVLWYTRTNRPMSCLADSCSMVCTNTSLGFSLPCAWRSHNLGFWACHPHYGRINTV